MVRPLLLAVFTAAAFHLIHSISCAQSPASSASSSTSAQPTSKPIVLAVCPPGWQSAMNEWMAFRKSEYNIVVLEAKPTADALHRELLTAIERFKTKPAAIILCGDVDVPLSVPGDVAAPNGKREVLVPTFILKTAVKLNDLVTPTLSTDALFADTDRDGCPDVAIGRIPAATPEQLHQMLHKSIDYENASLTNTEQHASNWRNRIHVTAGIGGFGILADGAIEAVTRKFLSDGIPDYYRLNTTYASLNSPYCPNPYELHNTFIDRINHGGMFWVYIGHGNVSRLDDFQVGNQYLPICNGTQVSQFQIPHGPPIALILACFTGAVDAPNDCFAERLMRLEHGPVAVIAGSRVTMPYGMSEFAGELMEGCFRDRIQTLGELVLRGKQKIWNGNLVDDTAQPSRKTAPSMREKQREAIAQMATLLSPSGHDLVDERREHVRLMNLLGDPLLKLPYPQPLELNLPESTTAGSSVDLQWAAPVAGRAVVEMALTRDRLPEGVQSVREFTGSAEQLSQMQANYDVANNLVVWKSEQNVAPGANTLSIPVPAGIRGRYSLSVHLYSDGQWYAGSNRFLVRRPDK